MQKIIKIRYLILIIGLIFVGGYIIGQFFPFEYLHPQITDKELTVNDLYTRLIALLAAFVTFLAVIVALFKEDLRKFWDNANLSICFRDNNTLHEILDNDSSEGTNHTYRAKKYETVFLIKNIGKQAAKNCEIYLERLQFTSSTFLSLQDIQLSGQPLNWNNNSSTTILIPATGKALVSIIELLSPNSQLVTTEEADHVETQPKLKIGGTNIPDEFTNGTYLAQFIVYSENAEPIKQNLKITWNNRWAHRLPEMNRYITIEVLNN